MRGLAEGRNLLLPFGDANRIRGILFIDFLFLTLDRGGFNGVSTSG